MVASMAALGPRFYTPEQATAAARYLTVPDSELIEDGTLYVCLSPLPTLQVKPLEEGEFRIVAVGGWSSRLKLFTGSEDQEGLIGRLDPERDPARIRAFFVDPVYARRGIARRLYERCASDARAAGFRSFSLMATLPGVPLYRSLGFGNERPTVVTLPDGSGLPCIEMSREL